MVVVSVNIHLNALCQCGGGVAISRDPVTQHWREGFWRVEEHAVDEGSCCRDLSCSTLTC